MGFGGISIWQLLIVLVIVVLIFGTKKIRNMGGDLGGALKNFKSALDEGKKESEQELAQDNQQVIDELENEASKASEVEDVNQDTKSKL